MSKHNARGRRTFRRVLQRRLFLDALERRLLLTTVVSTDPIANTHTAASSASISATFDQDLNAASVATDRFVVHSSFGGRIDASTASLDTAGATVTMDPLSDFRPGEVVDVTATDQIESVTGNQTTPHVWQFRVGSIGSATFLDSGQRLGNHSTFGAAIGDLDGDGDLDVITANQTQTAGAPNRIWLNDGTGQLSDSGQRLGNEHSWGVALGDLDGDGDLDAIVENGAGGQGGTAPNRIWLNYGDEFRDSGREVGGANTFGIALGDLDGDGDLDAFAANNPAPGNRVHLNDGTGVLSDSGQALGGRFSMDAALGDIDGDGDLDAVVVNYGSQESRVWLNDGNGEFTDSGQSLGNHHGFDVSLGDLDGDGDLDALLPNGQSQPDRIWLNDGGVFTDSGQLLGDHSSYGAALGDFDGDGDLDAFVTNSFSEGNRVWINEAGTFSDSGQVFGTGLVGDPAVGDLDGDGDLDAFVPTLGANQFFFDPHTEDQDPVFGVSSLTPTTFGFDVEFTSEFDADALNLYDSASTGLGPADVMVRGATTGPISGSLVADADLRGFRFVKSGGPLPADTYTVTIRSAGDAFASSSGDLLDGDGDGAAGGDYEASFTVDEMGPVVISIPDFVRGPGQPVNLPADSGIGIPISISDAAGVRSVQLRLRYNPALLEIDSATVGLGLPGGAAVSLDTSVAGDAVLNLTSPVDLPAGTQVLAHLVARVPSGDGALNDGKHQVLHLEEVTITDANTDEIAALADSALHQVSYFGDVSGNGSINAGDAAALARVAALIDGGFGRMPLTDPVILGDISGNDRVNAADASLVAQFAALLDVPEIPEIPSGGAAARPLLVANPEFVVERDLDDRGANTVKVAASEGERKTPRVSLGSEVLERARVADQLLTEFGRNRDETLIVELEEFFAQLLATDWLSDLV